MQFNSFDFILYFLPVFIVSYLTVSKVSRLAGKYIIIIASMIFYALVGGVKSSIILMFSAVANYILASFILRTKKYRGKKLLFVLGTCINIITLIVFKYYNFATENLNLLFGLNIQRRDIILPMGVSFYTFQQIMYLRNILERKCVLNLTDYLTYILYFPKLIMGPIVESDPLIAQINDDARKRINADNIACGLKIFSFGLFKKMVLANTFFLGVNWGYQNISETTSGDWILIALFYTFEIYFDFSGYIDMATGVSKMINIDLPINFDSPYKALSIRNFWKRWHISLTVFFTKYIYIPLGGSKKGKIRTLHNILIVFLISGLWHGANWTFIVWGLIHGFLQVIERIIEKYYQDISEAAKWIYTFTAVSILWLLFRCESLSQWNNILVKILSFRDMSISEGLVNCFILPETNYILDILHLHTLNSEIRGLSMMSFLIMSFVICLVPENNYRNINNRNVLYLLLSIVAFVWSFLCLGTESTFVYNNF